MGDIKAKDLNTAGSVAAGDKILGSSINGTTANVTVETLENHAVDTKLYSSLSNQTVSAAINSLKSIFSSMSNIQQIGGFFTTSSSNTWEYTNYSLTIPNNHLYAIWGETVFYNNAPRGCALSSSSNSKAFLSVTEVPDGQNYYITRSPIILVSGATVYLYEKRDHFGQNQSFIKYIDLFTI